MNFQCLIPDLEVKEGGGGGQGGRFCFAFPIASSRLVAPGSPRMGQRKIYDRKMSVALCVLDHSYYQQTFWVASDIDSEVDHFTRRKTKRTNVGRARY